MTPHRKTSRRVKAYKAGLWAEALCRLALRVKGYTILASRYRSPWGEIDIVAVRGGTVAVIEVKARADREAALQSVLPRQLQRLERAARGFVARHPRYHNHIIRFDVMLVTPWQLPRHLTDAWRP